MRSDGTWGEESPDHFRRGQLHLDIVGQVRGYLDVSHEQLAYVIGAGEKELASLGEAEGHCQVGGHCRWVYSPRVAIEPSGDIHSDKNR